MPIINHILETALYVADRTHSQAFYETVLGFRALLDDGNRLTGMAVGETNQVLLLFEVGKSVNGEETPTGFIPPHDGHGTQHLAFAISAESLDGWMTHLSAHGVAIESTVKPERGGTSLYFRDPDNHLIELATPGIWPTY